MSETAGTTFCFAKVLDLAPFNLFVAGKTISATREAMCSSRVMAQCMGEGQAAGTAAALCCQLGCTSTELDIKLLRENLLADGARLS